jgi:hypothetical protein
MCESNGGLTLRDSGMVSGDFAYIIYVGALAYHVDWRKRMNFQSKYFHFF